MALGHYDDNGIWIYGEDDAAAPGGEFSAMLNKLAESLSPGITNIVNRRVTELEADPNDAVVAALVATDGTGTRDAITTLAAAQTIYGGVPFADAAARDAAITAPVTGMRAFLTGTHVLTRYNGAAWTTYDGTLPFTVASGFTLAGGTIIRVGRQVTITLALTATAAYTALNPIATITDATSRPVVSARLNARNGSSGTNGMAYVDSSNGQIVTQIAIASGNAFDITGSYVAAS